MPRAFIRSTTHDQIAQRPFRGMKAGSDMVSAPLIARSMIAIAAETPPRCNSTGVKQVRVRRGLQGRSAPPAMSPLVAARDIGEDLR